MSKPIQFTTREGGQFLEINMHSIIFPDDVRWDEKNGFSHDYSPIAIPIKSLSYTELVLGQLEAVLEDPDDSLEKKLETIETLIKAGINKERLK